MPDESRQQALDAVDELLKLRETNPLWFYNHPTLSSRNPHIKQLEFHGLHTQMKAFFGGNQSGKTTAGLADDLIQALDEDDLPMHLREYKRWEPPFFCRIFSESVPVLETVIYPKLKELLPSHTLLGGSWTKAYDVQLRILRFKNGSMFQFMTYEQDVGKMGGATLKRIHFDEEPPERIYGENKMRLLKYRGDMIFTMTPLNGLTWSYDLIWQHRGEMINKDVYMNEAESLGVITVDMDDNPYLSGVAKVEAMVGLSDEEKAARKTGLFVPLTGRIYGDFSEELILPQDDLPENVNVVVGIDPGYGVRCGVVWTALTADDTMFIFDELYEGKWTVEQVANEIHKRNAYHGVLPIYYVIDPAARNKYHQTGRSDQMEFADHGIPTIPGQHDVRPGINRVRERLQNRKLFIYDSCVNTIDEFRKYRWRPPRRTGEETQPGPFKKDDHLLDALRYVIMSRPYVPQVQREVQERPLQRAMREDRERTASPTPQHEFGAIFN